LLNHFSGRNILIDGIYVAASGGFKQEKSLEVISNNLANVNTVGYKRDTLAFKEFLAPFPDGAENEPSVSKPGEHNLKKDASYTGVVELKTDFSQGGLRETGNPLDVALDGEGFFAIQTKDGVRYTRQGNFRLNNESNLTTHDGNLVLGAGGPITIQGIGNTISIDAQGKISLGDGLANEAVGDLRIVKFDDPKKLIKTGDGLFMLNGTDAEEIAADNFSVKQGAIESSNVTGVQEMTKMIEVLRTYEAYQKVIQTIDSANAKAVTDIGRLA